MREHLPPDPDELLKAIQQEDIQEKTGHLKIFFGMSAGVGKTYAMLEEAQRILKEGVDVIVGTINTHRREETEKILKGLPIIPLKELKYRDATFEEMDLEAILKRKPSVVLVDELAHTNVPGSRHSKRWQDVIEILDAGINVYTTLNVQHLESRKDLIESIAGIQIRETVPDLILERASGIELIDISPMELLKRLKEGKVYLGVQSHLAAQNFFQEDTLTALREIALRFTAEKVDHDLHSILSTGKKWKAREKLLLAVNLNPDSHKLVRMARRHAFELDAAWVAVYVDTGVSLNQEDKARLAELLHLVQDLGGEGVITKDTDIAAALHRIARQKNITRLIIGRPPSGKWSQLFEKGVINRLIEQNKQIDVLVVREEDQNSNPEFKAPHHFSNSGLFDYTKALISVAAITLVGYISSLFVGYKAIGFIYLIGIVFLSLFLGQGPIFFSAFLSTVAWDLFFTPPILSHSTSIGSETVIILIFFLTATIIGLLIGKISKQEIFLKIREKKLENLYEMEREIATASDYLELRKNLSARLESLFEGEFDIVIEEPDKSILFNRSIKPLIEEKEQTTALWVLKNGKEAGWSTTTLPSSKGLYLPLKFLGETRGFLVFYPKRNQILSVEEMNFLLNVTQQVEIYLSKTHTVV